MTWTDAFRGIQFPTQRRNPDTTSGRKFVDEIEDAADVIERRKANRIDTEVIRVPIRVLYDIAKRIESQSEEIARLSGAGAPLDAAALAEYEAKQAEAERAAVKTGVLVRDLEGDWVALYNATGACVTQGHVSDVMDAVVHDGWSVTTFDADGFLFDWNGHGVPGPDDYQEFPAYLGEFQRAYTGRHRTEKPARVPEDPITGEIRHG